MTITLDYVNIDYSNASPASTWYASPHVIDGGHNTGWTITPMTGTPGIYIVPAITDGKLLPSLPWLDVLSSNISLQGCGGEYLSASFAIYTTDGITGMTATISDLTGPATIDKSAINLRVVKVWYQAGVEITDVSHKQLTPELLLKDDSIIYVSGTDNYASQITTPFKISGATQPEGSTPTPAQMPIQDNAALQPVTIPAGTNKQFWITLHIPDAQAAGTYTGTITLSGGVGTINLTLTVLPFTLLPSNLIYSIYWRGVLDASYVTGSIGYRYKSVAQLTAEMTNLINHGVTNPTIYQPFADLTRLETVLTLRDSLGIGTLPLYYIGLTPYGYQDVGDVATVLSHAAGHGITDVYFYGVDEATGTTLTDQRASWTAIRAAGGKMFVAGDVAGLHPPGNYAGMGDIQDLQIQYDPLLTVPLRQVEAAKWHSVGHKIFSYSNPQGGLEQPETYRRNYGLLLWQDDYDGCMMWAYQGGFGNIWNDFDDAVYRDHVMAYPTVDGVIDTIQWEGFREGVNDTRYLATLQYWIAHSIYDTTMATAYLANLKTVDLTITNLNAVRATMQTYIQALQSGGGGLATSRAMPRNLLGIG